LCGLKEGAAVKAREKARKVHRREIKTNEKRAKKSKRAQILVRWALLFFSVVFFRIGRRDQYRGKTSRPMRVVRLSGKRVQSVCGGRFAPTKLK